MIKAIKKNKKPLFYSLLASIVFVLPMFIIFMFGISEPPAVIEFFVRILMFTVIAPGYLIMPLVSYLIDVANIGLTHGEGITILFTATGFCSVVIYWAVFYWLFKLYKWIKNKYKK